ncbi:thermonuclease family protein [Candidatus Mycoplasma pogonae]
MSLIAAPLSVVACSYSTKKAVFVTKVFDGDTFTDNDGKKYRIFGINSLEMTTKKGESRISTTGKTRYWAQKATNKLIALIEHKTVQIQYVNSDKYDRYVVKVYLKGQDIAFLLLVQGLYEVKYISDNVADPFFNTDVAYYKQLLQYQQIAQEAKKGIWSR